MMGKIITLVQAGAVSLFALVAHNGASSAPVVASLSPQTHVAAVVEAAQPSLPTLTLPLFQPSLKKITTAKQSAPATSATPRVQSAEIQALNKKIEALAASLDERLASIRNENQDFNNGLVDHIYNNESTDVSAVDTKTSYDGITITNANFSGTTATLTGDFNAGGIGAFTGDLSTGGNLTVTGNTTLNGSVGIGTSSPYSMLAVAGQIVAQNFVATSSTATSTIGGGGLAIGTSTPMGNGFLTVGTSSGNVFYIDRVTGNVGIGTTTPQSALSISGSASGTFNALTLRNKHGSSGDLTRIVFQTDTQAFTTAAIAVERDSTVSTRGNFHFYTGSNGTLTDKMFIGAGTGIGIATTTPLGALDVAGVDSARVYLSNTNNGVPQDHWFMESTDSGSFNIGTTSATTQNTNNAYRALTINSTGNVGIGVSDGSQTAAAALTVAVPTAVTRAFLLNTQNNIGLTHGTYFSVVGGTNFQIVNQESAGSVTLTTNAGAIAFSNGSEVGRFDTSGNFGVGNASPSYKLDVSGIGRFTGIVDASKFTATSTSATSTFAGFIDVTGSGTNATSTFTSNLWVKGSLRSAYSYVGDLVFANGFRYAEATDTDSGQALFLKNQNDQSIFSIDENGNVGLGTTAPTYKLQVIGDVAAQSFVNISTRSSKKDISYLSPTDSASIYDKIRNIKVAEYRYLNEDEQTPLHIGLIAEEAPFEVLSVTGKGVDVYKLASITLLGVQTLQSKYDSLDTRVTALEAQLAKLASTTVPTITLSTTTGPSLLDDVLNLKNVIVESLTAKKATVDTLCVGNTCVTETELKILLNNANLGAVAAASTPSSQSSTEPSTTPAVVTTSSAPTVTPEASPSPSVSPTPTPAETPASTPAPATSPAPEVTETPAASPAPAGN